MCVSSGCLLQGRGLPADRRGACCFLLGMLLREFPLDFSCRDQSCGRVSVWENKTGGERSRQPSVGSVERSGKSVDPS